MKGPEELYNFKKNLQQMQQQAAAIYDVGRAAVRASSRPNALTIPTIDPAEVRSPRPGRPRSQGCALGLTLCRRPWGPEGGVHSASSPWS